LDLADKVRKHANANNLKIFQEVVVGVDFDVWPYQIITKRLTDGEEIKRRALSCIIAMGSTPKFLHVPGEQDYWGKGISNCAVCDGSLYKDKVVAVVGGADVAMEEALYLSNIAKQVYVLVRSKILDAKGSIVQEVQEKENVTFLYNKEIKKIEGDVEKLTHVVVIDNTCDKTEKIRIDGLFLAIGSIPNSQIFKGKLEQDPHGYILVDQYQETSKKGIFAIGDISDYEFRQLITAAAAGCKSAFRGFLEEIGYKPKVHVQKKRAEMDIFHGKSYQSNKALDLVQEDEFVSHVLKNTRPVVVDFFSQMCFPCKKMLPILDELKEHFHGVIDFFKVDVAALGSIAKKFGVYRVPTFIFFKDGKEIGRVTGVKSFNEFKETIEDMFDV
jgi:thioredoxin reductase (NADPH)